MKTKSANNSVVSEICRSEPFTEQNCHLLQFVEALEVCDAALMEFPEDFRYLLFTKVYHTTPFDQLSFQESQI